MLFLVLLGILLPCAHTFVGVSRQTRPLSPSLADGVRRDHMFGLSTSTCSSNAAVTRGPGRRANNRDGRVLMGTEEVSGCSLDGYSWSTFMWAGNAFFTSSLYDPCCCVQPTTLRVRSATT